MNIDSENVIDIVPRCYQSDEQQKVVIHSSQGRLRMKLKIEKSACVGNARCATISAELFPLDADGYIAVDTVQVPEGMEALARRGARACPEKIIFIEDV